MPDNWINQRKLTSEDAIYDLDGNKINDLIDTEVYGGEELSEEDYPVLWNKLVFSIDEEYSAYYVCYAGYEDEFLDLDYLNPTNSQFERTYDRGVGVFNQTRVDESFTSCQAEGLIPELVNPVIQSTLVIYMFSGNAGVTQATCTIKLLNSLGGVILTLAGESLGYNGTHKLGYLEEGTINYMNVNTNSGRFLASLIFVDGVGIISEGVQYDIDLDLSDLASISIDGEVVNELLSGTSKGGAIVVRSNYTYKEIPTITRPTGSPHPYKIVADATSE